MPQNGAISLQLPILRLLYLFHLNSSVHKENHISSDIDKSQSCPISSSFHSKNGVQDVAADVIQVTNAN